ncbi:MAG: hypothetical protein QM778_05825 [Myxococcales bacterium]
MEQAHRSTILLRVAHGIEMLPKLGLAGVHAVLMTPRERALALTTPRHSGTRNAERSCDCWRHAR